MHRFIQTLFTVFLSLLLCVPASGHNGPPFPLVVDQRVGPCIVSVWTDPDVGTGTFFVILQQPPNIAIPNDLKIEIVVQPASGRLPEASYPAQREDLRGQVQYKALVNFDAQETWRVRILLQSAQGSGETIATVEATPPGPGRWDLLLYLLPFLAIALLWLRAVIGRRGRSKRI